MKSRVWQCVGSLLVGFILGIWLASTLQNTVYNIYFTGGSTVIIAVIVILSVGAGGSFLLIYRLGLRRNRRG